MAIEAVEDLRGPAGKLEALLNVGTADAKYAAVVCHPHPPDGGTMHTKAVFHAAKALNSFGFPVLRFNFRGVGLSDGSYAKGVGEVEDARAAIDWAATQFNLPLIVGGFSFGANMALRAGCGDPRVAGLIGLGTPLQAGGRSYDYDFLADCSQPKLFVTGAADPYAPRAVMEERFFSAPPPILAVWVPGADHFFAGTEDSPTSKLPEMRLAIEEWVAATFTF